MTQPTFAQLRSLSGGSAGVTSETIQERLLTLLAIIASGQNPDATAFTPGKPSGQVVSLDVAGGFGGGNNLWNATAVGVNGVSSAAATYFMRNWIIAGNANAATTISVQVSIDNVTYYTSSITAILAGAGDFVIDCRSLFGAFYVKLKSSAAATITAGVYGSY